MVDDLSDDVGIFDFDEFADHLLEQGMEASPSQLHGCVSGLLAAGANAEPEFGLNALSEVLDLDIHGEFALRLMQLYAVTAASLDDDEYTFHPLLPDDDMEISARTEALAHWCAGFLAGFAHQSVRLETSAEALSEDSSEVLRDIGAMAEAAVDAEGEDDNELEEHYMELIEYLRFAVLNVYTDNFIAAPNQDAPTPPPGSLH